MGSKEDQDTIEEAMEWLPEDMLKEVIEHEKLPKPRKSRKWRPFPTNKDIMRAIVDVTGGVIYGDTLENLHEKVVERLKQEGFEVRYVSARRVWRLVEYLVGKGRITIMV